MRGERLVYEYRGWGMPSNELATENMSRRIEREWSGYLTDYEMRVVRFIFDRTIMFGKLAEKIPLRHFMDGVYQKDGTLFRPGVNMARSPLYRVLDTLRNLGVVQSTASKVPNGATEYALNPVADPARHRPNGAPKPDHRQQTRARIRWGYYRNAPESQICEKTGSIEIIESRVPTGRDASVPTGRDASVPTGRDIYITRDTNMRKLKVGGKAAEEVIGALRKREAFSAERRSLHKTKDGALAYQRIWLDAIREAFPDHKPAAWSSKREFSVLKRIKARLSADTDTGAFLKFVAYEWRDLMIGEFGWMKRGTPPFPIIEFVEPHLDRFVNCFTAWTRTGFIAKRRAPKADETETAALRQRVADLEAKLAAKPTAPPAVPARAPFRKAPPAPLGRRRGPMPNTDPHKYGLPEWDE